MQQRRQQLSVSRLLPEPNMAKDWIQGAVKHSGAMTAAAKSEGVSNSSYESEHQHDSGKAGDWARLAIVLKGLKHAGPR